MDLRGLANGVTTSVNPNITVTVKRSAGYTVDPLSLKQMPAYDTPVTGPGQLQALDADDIKQLDGLNIQGTVRAIYLRGVLAGVVRPTEQGGDVVTIAAQAGVPSMLVGTWLVVRVLEGWTGWTKAAIVLQVPA